MMGRGNRLRRLYAFKVQIVVDDELQRKLEFIARRMVELERLQKEKLEEIERLRQGVARLRMGGLNAALPPPDWMAEPVKRLLKLKSLIARS
jgi:uncharacterized membrane protein